MPSDTERQEAKYLALSAYCAARKDHRTSPILAGNVIGIGIGPRIQRGRRLEEECVRFYVHRKIQRKEAVAPADRIKPQFGALRTDVIETRRVVSFCPKPAPGSSFGLAYQAPNVDPSLIGTVSAFVNIEGTYYALASNHAMTVNGRVPVGTEVQFRPPNQFVDGLDELIIACTTVHVPLSQSGINHSDCALAEVRDPDQIETQFPERIVSSAKLIDPQKGMYVNRVDDTEQASGVITDVNVRMKIDYRFGTFEFDDLILIEGVGGPFARSGDSGAIVVDRKTNKATALVVGGSRNYTLACPLSIALKELADALACQEAAGEGNIEDPPKAPPTIELLVGAPVDDRRKAAG